MHPEELRERTRRFAIGVTLFCRALPDTLDGKELARQLTRAGNGVASNYRAACRSRSRAEFAARIGVALEEADESEHWLGMAKELGLGERERTLALRTEAGELVRIFSASYRTASAPRARRQR